ncbi:MAG: hypothetical protein R3328_00255 [Planococcaceae bacterium]|nr:hypothetical protein [Planococcaceae bacterium]
MEIMKNMLIGIVAIVVIIGLLILVATNEILIVTFFSVMFIGLAIYGIYVMGSIIRMFINGDL